MLYHQFFSNHAFPEYGPALIEHVLLIHGFNNSSKIGKTFTIEKDIDQLMIALEEANGLFQAAKKQHSLVSIDVSKNQNVQTEIIFYSIGLHYSKKRNKAYS